MLDGREERLRRRVKLTNGMPVLQDVLRSPEVASGQHEGPFGGRLLEGSYCRAFGPGLREGERELHCAVTAG
nr:hypothetical protein KPHV_85040 [Kitasatospora purpeofusca]